MKSSKKKKKPLERFSKLLALIVDERSPINLKDIGTTSWMLSETVFGGEFQGSHFGGLPVVVLFGEMIVNCHQRPRELSNAWLQN